MLEVPVGKVEPVLPDRVRWLALLLSPAVVAADAAAAVAGVDLQQVTTTWLECILYLRDRNALKIRNEKRAEDFCLSRAASKK
jgi:hypothetical protein